MAGFVQNTKIRVGRVKVTERVESEPDHRGRRVLLAQAGEELSAEEAFRREIPVKILEGVGPSADVVMDAYRKATKDRDSAADVLAEGRQAALQAERDANQAADGRRAARIRGEYPQDRGGGTWLLSDGTTVTGDHDKATEAEAALHAETETDGTTPDPLTEISGVSDELAAAIRTHVDGVDTVTVETLVEVDGVGQKTAEKVLAALDGTTPDPLTEISGVSDELAAAIRTHVDGVDTVTVETLVEVDGVGQKTAEKVLAALDGS